MGNYNDYKNFPSMEYLREQFVPYDIAFKLKEMRFDESCFGYFNEKKELELQEKPYAFYSKNINIGWEHRLFSKGKSNLCSAPLWQQASDWLLKYYGVHIEVHPADKVLTKYEFDVYTTFEEHVRSTVERIKEGDARIVYSTKNEALENALLKAFELIENKQDER